MSKKQNGYTIVELTIAIAFLSVLMIAILVLTLSAGKLYVKGDTNKTINQSSRDFSDIVRRDFLSASADTISPVITVSGGTGLESGRICLGTVTYLWNNAALLNSTTGAANAARVKIYGSATPAKFVRIVNPQASYCDKGTNGLYPMTIASTEAAREQFSGTSRDYALYSMTIRKIAESGEKAMYQIKYTLGTNEAGTTQNSSEGYVQCKPDTSETANFDYCSVSDFDLLVRVGGTK